MLVEFVGIKSRDTIGENGIGKVKQIVHFDDVSYSELDKLVEKHAEELERKLNCEFIGYGFKKLK